MLSANPALTTNITPLPMANLMTPITQGVARVDLINKERNIETALSNLFSVTFS